ncbi:ligand-binding sensor domain-containing protein [Mucilaginibacter pocheonensis]|uniref:histidine kinase n=1 Tax=Mucilaginibacter pocheonensis TaxID=398050 RepID=A0ABU1T8M6_9SPHI|nr:two-component regulator propeller domain-containing protein [Mucilaginibacter pocheonensis]MDR6941659.1 ligand-binding sensor domain-containing protein/signal transduction histidine kinase [Mucilaginibacter pocheonensis]
MLKLFYILLAFFIFPTVEVTGQPYYFSHYQVESGLSSNSVMCSIQDKRGFLWFGTKDGLNCFNGYQFKVFRNDPDKSNSLGGNFIHSLYEDAKGTMWVGTDRGLYRYDQNTESFSKLSVSPVDEIRDIKADGQNNLWFIAGFTLHSYNQSIGKLTVYPIKKYLEATSICISSGIVWVATTAGTIKKYDPATLSFDSYSLFNKSKPSVSWFVERLFDTGKGSLLVGTSKQGVKVFDLTTHLYKDLLIQNEDNTPIFARVFIHNTGDEYWIGTESGIFIYTLSNNKSIQLKKHYNDPYSLSDNAIYTFCKDKEGGIWVGTYFGGVNYYSKQYAAFEKYFPKVGENAISGNAVREIHQDNNKNLWIGTEDAGLNKLGTNGKFTSYQPSNKPGSLSNNNIHGLLVTGDSLWVGTFESGLDIFRISTGKVIRHYVTGKDTNGLKSNFIYSIYRTRTGRVFLATGHGLFEYDYNTRNFKMHKEIPDLFYTEIMEDSAGTIWAGTYSNGLYYFNPKTAIGGKLHYLKKKDSSLNNDRVNVIYEAGDNSIWFGTERGLYNFDRRKQSLKKYTTKNGFPSDVIFSILPDEQKQLWISTSKGLLRFNPVTKDLKVYTKANGLLSDQFNYNSAYKDADGRMYFGSVKGMISFMPFKLKNPYTSPNYITGFQISNKEVGINEAGSPLKKSISVTDTIALSYNQSSFSIDFASLSFTSPEMTEYRYKMEGLDKDWTHLKSNRKVYFTGLAPGEYKFRFESSNYSGAWSKHPKTLVILIAPPYWASNWAYCIYMLLFIGVIYFSIRSYHERLENRNRRKIAMMKSEKEKEIYESKIAFFTNVAHEIRTPLTLIIAPMERVMKEANEVPSIKTNLRIMAKNTNRLLELTNQLLDFRKTEINGYNLNFVKTDVTELLNNTFTRFKGITQQKSIKFKLEAPAGKLIAYVDREALDKILSNLIDNAVKYAKSKVIVELLPQNDDSLTFKIQIKNDGHIIPQEKKNEIFETFYRLKATEKLSGTGIGLPLSRSLAELHKGTLGLLATKDEMNIFELELPIHQQMEFDIMSIKS